MPPPCAPGSYDYLAAAGWGEPTFYETTIEDLGAGVTRQALDAGADAVLVAGGDGTVRAVAETMSGSSIPLTIVPSGTGNLLARNLLLPLTDPDGDGPGDLRRRPAPDRRRLRARSAAPTARARSVRSWSWAAWAWTPR